MEKLTIMKQNSDNSSLLRNEKALNQIQTHNLAVSTSSRSYIHAATSDNTRQAYQTDIRHFIQWGGLLPTTAGVIMRYLQQYADKLNSRTLVRRLTALKNWHLSQGFADPTAHPAVRKTLTGIKNVHGKPKDKALPITIEILITMANYFKQSDRMIDCRNNAILQIGFFGAFRRSELVALQWEHIRFLPEGIEILIPRSKTDQEGEGQLCAIPYGDEQLCPITTLIKWRDRSQCESGFVFRQITKGQQLKDNVIKSAQVSIIIKSAAKICQLPDAEFYSSHSLRRGFATEASKKGAPFSAIMRQGRWRHEGTVLGYIEEGKLFDTNAADIILKNKEG